MINGRTLRLVHLANHDSNNIGNGALIFGLERVLQEDLGPGLDFTAEPWDAYTLRNTKRFDSEFVTLVNSHDALLVGGAVMMNGMRRYRHTGTRLDVPDSAWARLDRPIIFYSVATNFAPGHHYYHRDRLRRFLEERILAGVNVLFAVRNDGTKDWLESVVGHTSEKIVEIPDPALYVPTTDVPHPELDVTRPNMVLALNTEGEVYRFGGRWPDRIWRHFPGWQRRKREFLRRLGHALDRLARSHDINVILCPHCPSDHKMMAELLAHCSMRVSSYAIVSAGGPKASQARAFYDLYRKADVAVSMRIHSMTCAVGLGVPTVAIAGTKRMNYSMRDARLEDLAIDLLDPDLSDKLYAKVEWILEHRSEARCCIQIACAKMRDRTAQFNRRVASFLEERLG